MSCFPLSVSTKKLALFFIEQMQMCMFCYPMPWGVVTHHSQHSDTLNGSAHKLVRHLLSKAPEPGQSLVLDVDSFIGDVCSVAPELWGTHPSFNSLSMNGREDELLLPKIAILLISNVYVEHSYSLCFCSLQIVNVPSHSMYY